MSFGALGGGDELETSFRVSGAVLWDSKIPAQKGGCLPRRSQGGGYFPSLLLESPDFVSGLREFFLDLKPVFLVELSGHELVASRVVFFADLDKPWIDHHLTLLPFFSSRGSQALLSADFSGTLSKLKRCQYTLVREDLWVMFLIAGQ